MAGIKGKGGKKGASGRKSKAEEFGLQELLNKCWTTADREKCIKALAKAASDPLSSDRIDAVKLLMGYAYGKPREMVDVTSNGETVLSSVTVVIKRGSDNRSK